MSTTNTPSRTRTPLRAESRTESHSQTRNIAIVASLIVVIGVALMFGRSQQDNSPQARADRIASEIKCPTCQGLSVLQSKVGSAKLIYDEIVRRVEAGQSDGEVRSFLVSRYGQQQLLRPESTGIASIAWIAPVVVFIVSVAALGFSVRRNLHKPLRARTDDDELLVSEALQRFREDPRHIREDQRRIPEDNVHLADPGRIA